MPIFAIASTVLAGSMASSAQKRANQTNIRLAQENRDWQERMSNSEYQRAVQDLKAAGLNPMLAYSQGGNSTPNTSAATVRPEDGMATQIGESSARSVQAAQFKLNAAQTSANIQKTQAETRDTNASASIKEQQAPQSGERATAELMEIRQRVANLAKQEGLTTAQTRQIEEMLPELVASAQQDRAAKQQEINSAKARENLDKAALPEAESTAELWKKLGDKGKAAGWSMQFLKILKEVLR